MDKSDAYYEKLAAAYCRGTLGLSNDVGVKDAIEAGLAAKLPFLYRFKRYDSLLPRVKEIIGLVKSFGVETILDVASQRGALLWPLLDSLDGVGDVTSIDIDEDAVQFASTVANGGSDVSFRAERADVTDLRNKNGREGFASFADDDFECTICSEILEHLPDPSAAAREMLRVTTRLIICTVPAQPDNNNEHIQLFYNGRPHPDSKITRLVQRKQTDIGQFWLDAGSSTVKVRLVHDGPISVLLAVVKK